VTWNDRCGFIATRWGVEQTRTGPYVVLSAPEGGDFVSLSQASPVPLLGWVISDCIRMRTIRH